MSVRKIPDIVSPGDVDPQLVHGSEFGHYFTYQREDGSRVWQFHSEAGYNKFKMVGHLPKYKRSQNVSN